MLGNDLLRYVFGSNYKENPYLISERRKFYFRKNKIKNLIDIINLYRLENGIKKSLRDIQGYDLKFGIGRKKTSRILGKPRFISLDSAIKGNIVLFYRKKYELVQYHFIDNALFLVNTTLTNKLPTFSKVNRLITTSGEENFLPDTRQYIDNQSNILKKLDVFGYSINLIWGDKDFKKKISDIYLQNEVVKMAII